MLSEISQNFRGDPGNPFVSEYVHFLVDNRDWKLAELRAKSGPRRMGGGGGAK